MSSFKRIPVDIPGFGRVWLVSDQEINEQASIVSKQDKENREEEILGKILRELRGNESQVDFAKKIGVGERTLRAYEKGKEWPQKEKRKSMIEACGEELINKLSAHGVSIKDWTFKD